MQPAVDRKREGCHPRLDHRQGPSRAQRTGRLREEQGGPSQVVQHVDADHGAQAGGTEGQAEGVGREVVPRRGQEVGREDPVARPPRPRALFQEPRARPHLENRARGREVVEQGVEPDPVDVGEDGLARPDRAMLFEQGQAHGP